MPLDRPAPMILVPVGSQADKDQSSKFINVFETVTVWRGEVEHWRRWSIEWGGLSWRELAVAEPEFIEGMLTCVSCLSNKL